MGRMNEIELTHWMCSSSLLDFVAILSTHWLPPSHKNWPAFFFRIIASSIRYILSIRLASLMNLSSYVVIPGHQSIREIPLQSPQSPQYDPESDGWRWGSSGIHESEFYFDLFNMCFRGRISEGPVYDILSAIWYEFLKRLKWIAWPSDWFQFHLNDFRRISIRFVTIPEQAMFIDNHWIYHEIIEWNKIWILKALLDNWWSSDDCKCCAKDAGGMANDLHSFLAKLPQNRTKSENPNIRRSD
jgi:hypothetical protein